MHTNLKGERRVLKMNDKEIIKALRCMLGLYNNNIEYSINCQDCAFEKDSICNENCSEGIAKAVLELIEHQKAEINKLNSELKAVRSALNYYREKSNSLIAANSTLSNTVLVAKTEASEEFIKKMKECRASDINCVLKEMGSKEE